MKQITEKEHVTNSNDLTEEQRTGCLRMTIKKFLFSYLVSTNWASLENALSFKSSYRSSFNPKKKEKWKK